MHHGRLDLHLCISLLDRQVQVKVTLTGAVKTDTKEKWEVIFKNKRDHDHDTALSAILATSEEEL